MPAAPNTIEDLLQTFNRKSIEKDIKQAEDERWVLENGTKEVAPLATHGSQAFKIYFRKADNCWWYEGDSKD